MKPEELKRTGMLLYGVNWVRPLAQALEVHRNTVLSWNKKGMPEKYEDAVYIIKAKHVKKLLQSGKK